MIELSFTKEANETHKLLKKSRNKHDLQLVNAIVREKNNLKINPQKGIHIKRKYISKKLVEKYKTDKLWKINLPNYWRIIYALYGEDNIINIIILELTDYNKYNKLFGYKKK